MESLVGESAQCDDDVDSLVDSMELLVDESGQDDAAAASCAAINTTLTATTTEERD